MSGTSHATISGRLTWMNMLVSGAALLLASSIFFTYRWITVQRTMLQNLSIQAQIIGSNSVTALTFGDPSAASDTLSALKAAPSVVVAGTFTVDGAPFAEYWRDGRGAPPALPDIPPGQVQTEQTKDGRITIVRKVIFQGTTLGTVYIQSDLRELYDGLERYAAIIGLVLGASFIAALLVSRMSQTSISKPIVRLAETARHISREKDYSVRAGGIGHSRELTDLAEAFNEMLAQIQERESALQTARDELEQRVRERTRELESANRELEAFCYSVSHDLRAPLRGIDGFSQALLEDYEGVLDAEGKGHLTRVRAAAQRMAALIDDLLALSRISRAEIQCSPVDLTQMALSVVTEIRRSAPDRDVEFVVAARLHAVGDAQLIRTVLENLIGNAWKFTSKREHARIEVGQEEVRGVRAFFVRDNGAGFDQTYAGRLFGAFQRLHGTAEFPGTGIGLASVQRVVNRHGGKIWAEGKVDQGAAFYFVLSPKLTESIEGEKHGEQDYLVGGRQSR